MLGSSFFRCFDAACKREDLADMAAFLADPANHEAVSALHAVAPRCLEPSKALCAVVVFILLREPKEPNDPFQQDCTQQTSIRFVRIFEPQTMSRWVHHTDVLTEGSRVVSVQVSSYLYHVLCAAEDLFGLPGHLVRRNV